MCLMAHGRMILAICGIVLASACSHGPRSTPNKSSQVDLKPLFEKICAQGQQNIKISGTLWMKTQADGIKGQFPASVMATAPDQVQMEVTNAFGGSEAWIEVKGAHYTVKLPEGKGEGMSGRENWRGIPLRWAADLFLDRVPCVSLEQRAGAKLDSTIEDQLIVQVPNERFVYEGDFSNPQRPRVDLLRWEKSGESVTFAWSGSQKWEIKSSQGEVKIKWTEREVEENKK